MIDHRIFGQSMKCRKNSEIMGSVSSLYPVHVFCGILVNFNFGPYIIRKKFGIYSLYIRSNSILI